MVRFYGDKAKADAAYAYVLDPPFNFEAHGICSGCEPLTPDDIAEVVVFAAGRRENVVIADTLIFPNHQVSSQSYNYPRTGLFRERVSRMVHLLLHCLAPVTDRIARLRQLLCIGNREYDGSD